MQWFKGERGDAKRERGREGKGEERKEASAGNETREEKQHQQHC